MLNRMCSSPPCSHVALSTVHQRPNPNTGTAPLAPNRKSAGRLGAMNENIPSMPRLAPEPRVATSVRMYRIVEPPMTIGTKPMSPPSCRSIGPKPHRPGLARPQL